jgi:hypothetical protein
VLLPLSYTIGYAVSRGVASLHLSQKKVQQTDGIATAFFWNRYQGISLVVAVA